MSTRLADFIAERATETYPEPRSAGHDGITAKMAAEVAKHLEPMAHVLDVGCGQGPALEWFTREGFTPTGIALNAEDVSSCRERGFLVAQSDMHSSGFCDGLFDCVWARHVLEHSIAPFFALHEFARVLKPGGILYVEVPAPDTSCAHETNQNHYSVMGWKMWLSLIQRSGFDVINAMAHHLQTGAGPDIYFSYICKTTK